MEGGNLGGGADGGTFVRGSYKSFQEDKSDDFEKVKKKCNSLSWRGGGWGGGGARGAASSVRGHYTIF